MSKVCEFCQLSFLNGSEFEHFNDWKHLKMIGVLRFHCVICELSIIDDENFRNHVLGNRHKKNVRLKEIYCRDCDEYFSDAYALRGHMPVHSNTMDKLTCNICPCTSFEYNGFKKHCIGEVHLINAEIKKLYCEICQIAFTYSAFADHLLEKEHLMKIAALKIKDIKFDDIKIILDKNNTFSDNLELFLKSVTPSTDEVNSYENITLHLDELFGRFTESLMEQFSSRATGLGLKTDPLKLFVNIGQCDAILGRSQIKRNFSKIWTRIHHDKNYIRNDRIFQKAKKIVFLYIETNIICELFFDNRLDVYKSYLKNHCASIDPRFKPSMTIIKYWAKLNELSTQFSVIEESTDLYISNYALEMLFLFYLQQPNVYLIPPITTLKMNCRHPEFVNGWQINIDETIQHPSADNKILIPELLWGFFKFYAEFDFEQFVICPLDGCAHSREAFQNINELPESMNSYKEYIQNTRIAFLFDATKPLCIQDPIVLNENCCKRVSSNFVTSFKEHADRAASICEIACINEDHSNLLQNLFETSYKNNDLD